MIKNFILYAVGVADSIFEFILNENQGFSLFPFRNITFAELYLFSL